MDVSAIVACTARRHAIGRKNSLPWRLPADMQFFRSATTNGFRHGDRQNALVMGRLTWESIKRKLPNRINVVLTRSCDAPHEKDGVIFCPSFESAYSYLSGLESRPSHIWVIGGAVVYEEVFRNPICRRIFLTRIDAPAALEDTCDTFVSVPSAFEARPHAEMERALGFSVAQSGTDAESGLKFEFIMYERR